VHPTCAHSDASAPTPHQPSCEAIDHARNVATRARAPRRRARVGRVVVCPPRRRAPPAPPRTELGESALAHRNASSNRSKTIACHHPLHTQTQNVTQPRSNDTHARTRPSPAVRHTRCAPLHAPTHPTLPPHTTTHAITPHHTTPHTTPTSRHCTPNGPPRRGATKARARTSRVAARDMHLCVHKSSRVR
jgi:hypothetical protein